jgi:hypothetical protein
MTDRREGLCLVAKIKEGVVVVTDIDVDFKSDTFKECNEAQRLRLKLN